MTQAICWLVRIHRHVQYIWRMSDRQRHRKGGQDWGHTLLISPEIRWIFSYEVTTAISTCVRILAQINWPNRKSIPSETFRSVENSRIWEMSSCYCTWNGKWDQTTPKREHSINVCHFHQTIFFSEYVKSAGLAGHVRRKFQLSVLFQLSVWMLKCPPKVFFFAGHLMSGEISKCPARDSWFTGQNVQRSSKSFYVLCFFS